MFIGLTALSANGGPVPGVATEWETTADGKTWTFHLRHDAVWSNGEALTAGDFVYAFRRLFDPTTRAKNPSSLSQIVGAGDLLSGRVRDPSRLGVAAPDAHTVRIDLTDPVADLLLLLTAPNAAPLYRGAIERWGDNWTQPAHLISNGPFVLARWLPQAEIVLTRNPHFFEADTVKIDEVHWIVSEDEEAALRLYRTGGLDWVALTPSTRAWAEHAIPAQIHAIPSNGTDIIAFNLSRTSLGDRRVREAISLAIDRDRWVREVAPIKEPAGYALIPDIVPNYTPQVYAWKDMPQKDRVDRARGLMEAAGYGPDHLLRLTIGYTTSDFGRRRLLAIRESLRAIHVDVDLQNLEWKATLARMEGHDYDLLSFCLVDNDDTYAARIGDFVSSAGERNYASYQNPAFDDVYHRAEAAREPESRRALMQEAERMLLNDYAVVPLAQHVITRLINPKLVGGVDRFEVPQSRYLGFQS